MGIKSTREVTREWIENKIQKELYNIDKLNDDTLSQILEIIGEDENSEVSYYDNYMIIG